MKRVKRGVRNDRNVKDEAIVTLECKRESCYNIVDVPESVTAVLCWKCVQIMSDPPDGHIPYDVSTREFLDPETREPIDPHQPLPKKPRKWKEMKVYVDRGGRVFHMGIEQPGLKGTLEPTPVKVRVAINRKPRTRKTVNPVITEQQKIKILAELQKAKSNLKNETRKSYINKYERRIKKLEKELL